MGFFPPISYSLLTSFTFEEVCPGSYLQVICFVMGKAYVWLICLFVLEFLKTLKGAKPEPDEFLKSNVSPLRKYQNIYYTLPCHVGLKYIKYLPDYRRFP